MRLAFKREPLLLLLKLLGGAPLGGALEGEAGELAWVPTRDLGKSWDISSETCGLLGDWLSERSLVWRSLGEHTARA